MSSHTIKASRHLLLLQLLTLLYFFPYKINATFLLPPHLTSGDTIALVSPSRPASQEKVEKLESILANSGYTLITAPNAMATCDGYAGTPEQRLSDLRWAIENPSVKAIIASRGGYGAIQILDSLASINFVTPKWLIGFSDFTIIHAWLSSRGIASIHGPMANTIKENTRPQRKLADILGGKIDNIIIYGDTLNRPGKARGIVRGGNLAVLADLIGTPYDMILPGTILFIEDIEEPIYKVERILWQLKLSGKLDSLSGLIVGEFTDYKPERQYSDMKTMIANMTAGYSFPVVFNAPIGHVSWNEPILTGVEAELTVTPSGDATLKYIIE